LPEATDGGLLIEDDRRGVCESAVFHPQCEQHRPATFGVLIAIGGQLDHSGIKKLLRSGAQFGQIPVASFVATRDGIQAEVAVRGERRSQLNDFRKLAPTRWAPRSPIVHQRHAAQQVVVHHFLRVAGERL
jgi:hypothetical protein